MTLSTTPMDKYERKSQMDRKGITQQSIAESFDPPIRRQSVSLVVSGKSVSARIQRKIAEELDEPFEKVWGVSDQS